MDRSYSLEKNKNIEAEKELIGSYIHMLKRLNKNMEIKLFTFNYEIKEIKLENQTIKEILKKIEKLEKGKGFRIIN